MLSREEKAKNENKKMIALLVAGALLALLLDMISSSRKGKRKNAKRVLFTSAAASAILTANGNEKAAKIANGASIAALARLSFSSKDNDSENDSENELRCRCTVNSSSINATPHHLSRAAIEQSLREHRNGELIKLSGSLSGADGRTLGRVLQPIKRENIRLQTGDVVKVYYSEQFEPYTTRDNGKTGTSLFMHLSDRNRDGGKYSQIGVYIIRDSSEKIVYVGYSSNNLYSRLYRHFQAHDAKHAVHVYPKFAGYTVQIVQLENGKENLASELEKYFILSLQPRDNIQKYIDYGFAENDTLEDEEQQPEEEEDIIGEQVDFAPF